MPKKSGLSLQKKRSKFRPEYALPQNRGYLETPAVRPPRPAAISRAQTPGVQPQSGYAPRYQVVTDAFPHDNKMPRAPFSAKTAAAQANPEKTRESDRTPRHVWKPEQSGMPFSGQTAPRNENPRRTPLFEQGSVPFAAEDAATYQDAPRTTAEPRRSGPASSRMAMKAANADMFVQPEAVTAPETPVPEPAFRPHRTHPAEKPAAAAMPRTVTMPERHTEVSRFPVRPAATKETQADMPRPPRPAVRLGKNRRPASADIYSEESFDAMAIDDVPHFAVAEPRKKNGPKRRRPKRSATHNRPSGTRNAYADPTPFPGNKTKVEIRKRRRIVLLALLGLAATVAALFLLLSRNNVSLPAGLKETTPGPMQTVYADAESPSTTDGSGAADSATPSVSALAGMGAVTPTPTPTDTTALNEAAAATTATLKPTATSTPKPTATATPKPTATATPKPTATATPKPTATATPKPTATATPKPTATATPATAPTPEPTTEPTPESSDEPSSEA